MEYIEINRNKYKLYPVTGKVVSIKKRSQMEVSSSGGGGSGYADFSHTSDVKITSSTSIHDDLLLIDNEGVEHSFQLSNFDIACREGSTITVIAAIKEGNEKGPYIIVYNHNTNNIYYNDVSLLNLHTLNRLVTYICIVTLVLAASFVFGSAETAISFLAEKFFVVLGLSSLALAIWLYIKNILGWGICRSFKESSKIQDLKNKLKSYSLVD